MNRQFTKLFLLIFIVLLLPSCKSILFSDDTKSSQTKPGYPYPPETYKAELPTPDTLGKKAWELHERNGTDVAVGEYVIQHKTRYISNKYGQVEKGNFDLTSGKCYGSCKVYLYFSGKCNPISEITANFRGTENDFKKYTVSKDVKDIPVFTEVLKAMRIALTAQCPELKTLRVSLKGTGYRVNQIFKGTMQASKSWELENGYVFTPDDAYKELRLNYDALDGTSIVYEGNCSMANPVISLSRPYRPNYSSYYLAAKSAVAKFLQECRELNVESFRFGLSPIPEGYVCISPPCYMKLSRSQALEKRKKGNMEHMSDYVTKAFLQAEKPRDASDVITKLSQGKFDHLYNSFLFTRTFVDFIETYSRYCKSYINLPVLRKISLIETARRDGLTIDEKQIGGIDLLTIESEYVMYFDPFFAMNSPGLTFTIIGSVLGDKSSGIPSSGTVEGVVNRRISNKEYVAEYVADSCNVAEVQKVYKNMLKVARAVPL